ncbi:MAG: NOG1 family protein, partial [Methanosarcinales archaeon]
YPFLIMIFEKIHTVPTADELINKAFRRASRARKGKKFVSKKTSEGSMILTASNILSDNLKNIVRRFPNFDDLSLFYRELTDILVGIDKLKMSLSSVDWASKKIKEISRQYIGKLRKSKNPLLIRKSAYGRIASIMREIDSDLKFLNNARDVLRSLPDIMDEPTIVVAGYPNVGKSSFVSKVSSAKPQISTYPFTTKGIAVGHFVHNGIRYQVIDTPGLLDRPLSNRNKIELQALQALKYLGHAILFILDPSETCGYSLNHQLNLLQEIKKEFNIPILVVANKIDIVEFGDADMVMSALTGDGVDEVLNKLIESCTVI